MALSVSNIRLVRSGPLWTETSSRSKGQVSLAPLQGWVSVICEATGYSGQGVGIAPFPRWFLEDAGAPSPNDVWVDSDEAGPHPGTPMIAATTLRSSDGTART